MAIEEVSGTAVAICIDVSELTILGMDRQLSGKAARSLVNKALRLKGLEPWPETEIEIFACNGTLLLLARPAKYKNYCFRFENAEDMIAAALLCPGGLSSRLTYMDGDFMLNVLSTAEGVPAPLFEYGEPIPVSKSILEHMEEHGETIIPDNAVDVIKERFG